MEPKKNPKYDVHRNHGILLNLGLAVSLILVITAFEWATPLRYSKIELPHDDLGDLVYFPQPTTFTNDEAPKPKHILSKILVTPELKEISNADEKVNPPIGIDQGKLGPDIPFGFAELPVEVVEPDTFRVVEKMPEPVGGWETFYKTLKKHIKYPRRAERIGTKGKVFVEFTVNSKGELSHFKILKGIGHGCDEEAARVIALTKWTAGKQRGKAVNVRMVQPIKFSFE